MALVAILEVLFAILITSIGLLGAVAILPVASAQARRGRTNDAIAAAGRAAISRLDALGFRRPDRWITYHNPALNPLSAINYTTTVFGGAPFVLSSNFTDPRLPRLPWQEFQQYLAVGPNAGPPPARNWLGGVDSFCIDPRFVAANTIPTTTAPNTQLAYQAAQFPTFSGFASTPAAAGYPAMWRTTLYSGINHPTTGMPLPMSKIMADAYCQIEDELVFDRDNSDRSKPATLPYDVLAIGGASSARRSEGHLSWMATLAPERTATPAWPGAFGSPGALANNDLYTLSMVMFYDRPADLLAADPLHERLLQVASINGAANNSAGYSPAASGGEFELFATDIPTILIEGKPLTGEQQLKVKPNDWVCLAGQTVHQVFYLAGGTPQKIFVPIFKWYRVSDCEPEANPIPNTNPQQWHRFVTLIGQDWPLPAIDVSAGPSNGLRTWAIIVDGVVSVYEKSVRLEIGAAD